MSPKLLLLLSIMAVLAIHSRAGTISINWGQNYVVSTLTEASATGRFVSDVPTSAKRGSGKYLIDVEKLEKGIPGQGVIKEASNLVSNKPQTEYKVILHNIHEDKIRSNVIYDESEALETIQPTEEAEPLTTEFLHHEESKLDEAPDFMSKQECQAASNSIDVVKLKEDGRSNKNLYVPLVTMDNVKETSKRGRVGASTTENEFTQKVHIAISEEKIPSPTESIGGVEGDHLNEDEGHQSAVKDPISRALYNARLEGQVISQSLESGLEVKELEFQEANQLGIIEKQDETVEENLGREIEVLDMDMVQLSDLPINSKEEKQEMDEINAEGSSSPVTEELELYNTELMVTEEEEEKEMRVGDEHTPVH